MRYLIRQCHTKTLASECCMHVETKNARWCAAAGHARTCAFRFLSRSAEDCLLIVPAGFRRDAAMMNESGFQRWHERWNSPSNPSARMALRAKRFRRLPESRTGRHVKQVQTTENYRPKAGSAQRETATLKRVREYIINKAQNVEAEPTWVNSAAPTTSAVITYSV